MERKFNDGDAVVCGHEPRTIIAYTAVTDEYVIEYPDEDGTTHLERMDRDTAECTYDSAPQTPEQIADALLVQYCASEPWRDTLRFEDNTAVDDDMPPFIHALLVAAIEDDREARG